MRPVVVPLLRWFVPASPHLGDWEFLSDRPAGTPQHWRELEKEQRALVLADAGAGKTFEALARARTLHTRGMKAFFIRIEAISSGFESAFEVGTAEEFTQWLESEDEAWFFLDAVDEAQLSTPRALEAALRNFGERIHAARQRAHVIITSREEAWKAVSDRKLVEQYLPVGAPPPENGHDDPDREASKSILKVFRMASLSRGEMAQFAATFGLSNFEAFAAEIERADLLEIAGRPFDLKALIAKWQAHGRLGNRFEVLRWYAAHQLEILGKNDISIERALAGARTLAAAVCLTGCNTIQVPDAPATGERLDPLALLPGWSTAEIKALLSTGTFDDPVYGSVRVRHRELRELLTAEWAHNQLANHGRREKIEALFFRTCYGEEVLVRRLRPLLPWLILLDEGVRQRASAIDPEIAVEGGAPSQLPLEVRRQLLSDLIGRIVSERETSRGLDNTAIARIAAPDLSDDVQQLLVEHGANDDVVFLLGRLVWLGKMPDCVEGLFSVAVDPARGLYARIASIRAVMSIGSDAQHQALWTALKTSSVPLNRRLAAELLDGATPDSRSVEHFLAVVPSLEARNRHEMTGLERSLHAFIDRLPMMDDEAHEQPLAELVQGLNALLDEPPHLERGNCRVSEQNAWLMSPALKAVERLVGSRAKAALEPDSIAILLKQPALRFWRDDLVTEYKTKLGEEVPRWRELNDQLYWTSVAEHRSTAVRKGERLTEDWPLQIYGSFWAFGREDFHRCVPWITERSELDDKLVALSLCIRLFITYERPPEWRDALEAACQEFPELQAKLEVGLNPLASPEREKAEKQHRRWENDYKRRERKQERGRAAWVERLKADPDRVRHPRGLKPGDFSGDQYHLLISVPDETATTSRGPYANWRNLIPEFGEGVASAFRDAAVAHWREFRPDLPSEGANMDTTPYSLILGLAGLEIEAAETDSFPDKLAEEEARHALRYLFWDINGFPSWFEAFYRSHRALVVEVVIKELEWQLSQPGDAPPGSLLHDILYHAPWLHEGVAPFLLHWLTEHDLRDAEGLRYSLKILHGGKLTSDALAQLAERKLAQSREHRPQWFAVWVDTDPNAAIPRLEEELATLDEAKASAHAERFVAALLGDRHQSSTNFGAYRSPVHLKELYVLMHRYIRSAEDIERAGKGVYSPTLRDDAQEARNFLFQLLADLPGSESYSAIKALEQEHPEPSYRRWMAVRARERAIVDADEPLWTTEQFTNFYR